MTANRTVDFITRCFGTLNEPKTSSFAHMIQYMLYAEVLVELFRFTKMNELVPSQTK